MDSRLEAVKAYPRAMNFYVLTLYEIIKESSPEVIIEIGTQNGQSTKAMLLGMKDSGNQGRMISLDHKDRQTILDAEYSDMKSVWKFIQGDSHQPESLEAVKESLNGSLADVLFIDGDHKMPGVQQDFDQYTPLVKPGGVIIMHDIINPNEQVSQCWDAITWEKFAFTWGKARNRVPVGFGLVRKPYETELETMESKSL